MSTIPSPEVTGQIEQSEMREIPQTSSSSSVRAITRVFTLAATMVISGAGYQPSVAAPQGQEKKEEQPKSIPELIKLLDDDDFDTREETRKELERRPRAEVMSALKAVKSPSPEVVNFRESLLQKDAATEQTRLAKARLEKIAGPIKLTFTPEEKRMPITFKTAAAAISRATGQPVTVNANVADTELTQGLRDGDIWTVVDHLRINDQRVTPWVTVGSIELLPTRTRTMGYDRNACVVFNIDESLRRSLQKVHFNIAKGDLKGVTFTSGSYERGGDIYPLRVHETGGVAAITFDMPIGSMAKEETVRVTMQFTLKVDPEDGKGAEEIPYTVKMTVPLRR